MRDLVLEKLQLLVQQQISQYDLEYVNPNLDVYLDQISNVLVLQLRAEIMKHKHERIRAEHPVMFMPVMECPSVCFQPDPFAELERILNRKYEANTD